MAAYQNRQPLPGLSFLLSVQYGTFRMHASINTTNAANTPPTVPPHASHCRHPTTIGPGLSNDPTKPAIILDQMKQQFISIKLPGSTDWKGMCALNRQQTHNFISVEAFGEIGLTLENGSQYTFVWILDNDNVERAGIFHAVSRLDADVVFGVNWLYNCPGPAAATAIASIDASPHSPSSPSTGMDTTGHRSTPSRQLSINDHPAGSGNQDSYGDTGHQNQGAPISMDPYAGRVLWPVLGCLALVYMWQKARAVR